MQTDTTATEREKGSEKNGQMNSYEIPFTFPDRF